MVISLKVGRILSWNSDFLKVHSIFFKAKLFSTCSTHMVTQQVAQKQKSQPDPMAELPVARWTQGVHDKPGKKI